MHVGVLCCISFSLSATVSNILELKLISKKVSNGFQNQKLSGNTLVYLSLSRITMYSKRYQQLFVILSRTRWVVWETTVSFVPGWRSVGSWQCCRRGLPLAAGRARSRTPASCRWHRVGSRCESETLHRHHHHPSHLAHQLLCHRQTTLECRTTAAHLRKSSMQSYINIYLYRPTSQPAWLAPGLVAPPVERRKWFLKRRIRSDCVTPSGERIWKSRAIAISVEKCW